MTALPAVVSDNDVTTLDLARFAMSGQHLHWWLPGGDHKTARSAVVTNQTGGTAPGGRWYQVVGEGVGLFANLRGRKPAEAVLFLRWRELAEIVAAGCGDGRRERYESALADFTAWARDGGYTDPDHGRYVTASRGIRETAEAILAAGAAALSPRRVPARRAAPAPSRRQIVSHTHVYRNTKHGVVCGGCGMSPPVVAPAVPGEAVTRFAPECPDKIRAEFDRVSHKTADAIRRETVRRILSGRLPERTLNNPGWNPYVASPVDAWFGERLTDHLSAARGAAA